MSLKTLCRKHGYTLTEVAKQTNTTVDYLSKLNTGRRNNPRWKLISEIATILKIEPQDVGNAISKEE